MANARVFAISHVYVMTIPTGMVKVGIAEDPQSRLRGIQTGCPYQVSLHMAFPMSREAAYEVERAAHELLGEKSSTGEWFDCSADEACFAVARALDNIILERNAAHKALAERERRRPVFRNGKLTEMSVFGSRKAGVYADGGGLYLRVHPGGAKTFLLRIMVAGERREIKIGNFPQMKLFEARELAAKERKALKNGEKAAMIRLENARKNRSA